MIISCRRHEGGGGEQFLDPHVCGGHGQGGPAVLSRGDRARQRGPHTGGESRSSHSYLRMSQAPMTEIQLASPNILVFH